MIAQIQQYRSCLHVIAQRGRGPWRGKIDVLDEGRLEVAVPIYGYGRRLRLSVHSLLRWVICQLTCGGASFGVAIVLSTKRTSLALFALRVWILRGTGGGQQRNDWYISTVQTWWADGQACHRIVLGDKFLTGLCNRWK